MNNKTIGQRIKLLMNNKDDISNSELVRKIRVHPSYISKLREDMLLHIN